MFKILNIKHADDDDNNNANPFLLSFFYIFLSSPLRSQRTHPSRKSKLLLVPYLSRRLLKRLLDIYHFSFLFKQANQLYEIFWKKKSKENKTSENHKAVETETF